MIYPPNIYSTANSGIKNKNKNITLNYDVLNISAVKPIDKDGYIESCGLMVEQNLMNVELGELSLTPKSAWWQSCVLTFIN